MNGVGNALGWVVFGDEEVGGVVRRLMLRRGEGF